MDAIASVWFEIPAADIQRAQAFYEHALDCTMALHELGPLTMAWFPAPTDGKGATGTLVQAASYTPSHDGAVVYLAVDDIEAVLKRVAEKGGTVLNPKNSIGEHGFVAHFQDSEGNRVGLHSEQ